MLFKNDYATSDAWTYNEYDEALKEKETKDFCFFNIDESLISDYNLYRGNWFMLKYEGPYSNVQKSLSDDWLYLFIGSS